MARAIREAAPLQAALDLYVGAEIDLVHQISGYICAQAERLLGMADQISKVDLKNFQ